MTNRKRLAWPWVVGPPLAVVLYILSYGPAVAKLHKLVATHPASIRRIVDAFNVFYAPLQWTASKSKTVDAALIWYTDLWRPPVTR